MPKHVIAVILILVAAMFGCSRQEFTEKDFVGKWKSSRATTPIHLYPNGEWELEAEDGSELQYGVWQYFDNKIMWSFILDDMMGHDLNPVVSVGPREFKLREQDGTVTTFKKLD